MMLRFVFLAVILSEITACASMPSFDAPIDKTNQPTVSTIVDKIQCEIADALTNESNSNVPQLTDYKNFSKWTAAVTLTLTVDDSAGTAQAGLPLSFITPFSKAATSFAFNLSPTLYQLRTRTYTQTYTIDISKIPPFSVCTKTGNSSQFNLEGDLGLKDQIYMGLHSFNVAQKGSAYYASTLPLTGQPAAKTADTFGATVFFNVFYGVNNIGPAWTLTTFKGPTAGIGYVRNDLHQIVMTFAPTPKASKIIKPPPAPSPPSAPTVPPKPQILSEEAPENPMMKPEAKGSDADKFNSQKQKYDSYMTTFNTYKADIDLYNAKIAAYANDVKVYQAQTEIYKRKLDAYSQSIPTINAGDVARNANQTAVTTQAIQSLGQILTHP